MPAGSPLPVEAVAWRKGIRGVPRSHARARRAYDGASRWYTLLEEPFERRPRRIGVALLAAQAGERVVDIGCGPGTTLVDLARAVGPSGHVTGVDLSPRMAARARRRLRQAGLDGRADVLVADACALPFGDGSYDAAISSFTLELFDTPEMPVVLAGCRRVLRPGGRIVVVALSRREPVSRMTRGYERLHDRFPDLLDCRPIHVAGTLAACGFEIRRAVAVPLFGLRAEAVLATPA